MPLTCVVCGLPSKARRKGRCHRCNEYFRRNGKEWTPEAVAPVNWNAPCVRCARPLNRLARKGGRGLCNSCYILVNRHLKNGESPPAYGAIRDRCKKGHLLDEKNVRVYRVGTRTCLTCQRTAQRKWSTQRRLKRKAERERQMIERFLATYHKPVDPKRLLDQADAIRVFGLRANGEAS